MFDNENFESELNRARRRWTGSLLIKIHSDIRQHSLLNVLDMMRSSFFHPLSESEVPTATLRWKRNYTKRAPVDVSVASKRRKANKSENHCTINKPNSGRRRIETSGSHVNFELHNWVWYALHHKSHLALRFDPCASSCDKNVPLSSICGESEKGLFNYLFPLQSRKLLFSPLISIDWSPGRAEKFFANSRVDAFYLCCCCWKFKWLQKKSGE